MLKAISAESRARILLEFTKYLLMHSGYGELAELKEVIKEEEYERGYKKSQFTAKETIREIIHEKERETKEIRKTIKPYGISQEIGKDFGIRQDVIIPIRVRPRVLRIPEPRLPARLQYLKPTPHSVEIDLGKLNPFIMDPIVRRIECNGPGERVTVMIPTPKYTGIILNKEEIDEIINTFAAKSKIPAGEGIYRVVVGKFVFSAIISDVIGSKFTITKLNYTPIFR